MKQPDAVTQTHGEVRMAVIVEIASRACKAAPAEMDACFLCHVVESSIAQIVQQSAGAVRCSTHQEKIGFAIAVVVKEARAGGRSNPDAAFPCTLRHKRIRLRRKSHRNRRWHIYDRVQRQLRE